MENDNVIKNKIITISGEPVSGKGTATKELIEKLKTEGYTNEQIHVQSTGNEFRKYFNSVIELVINFDNFEKLEELKTRPELKDFFNNKEYRELLLETIIKLKKANTDLSKFTIQQANNSEEFHNIRHVVDSLIDSAMKDKGKEINSKEHPNDIWIIDSRLAFANIPESFSVRLTTRPEIAGKRLFYDKSRGAEDSKYKTIEEAISEREKRKIGERKRYLERYGIDLENEDNYDIIIDTSYSTPSDIANEILEKAKIYYKDTLSKNPDNNDNER